MARGLYGAVDAHAFRRRLLPKANHMNRSRRNIMFHQIALYGPRAASAQFQIVICGARPIGESGKFHNRTRRRLNFCHNLIE